jgi:hypothetical protein
MTECADARHVFFLPYCGLHFGCFELELVFVGCTIVGRVITSLVMVFGVVVVDGMPHPPKDHRLLPSTKKVISSSSKWKVTIFAEVTSARNRFR